MPVQAQWLGDFDVVVVLTRYIHSPRAQPVVYLRRCSYLRPLHW